MADLEDGAAGAPDEDIDQGNKDETDKRNRRLGRRDADKRRAFEAFVSTVAGRNWAFDFLTAAHCFHTSFPLSDNPYRAAFQEGERNMGLKMTSEIPAEYMVLLLKERGNG